MYHLLEEKRRDIVFCFPWCVVRNAWSGLLVGIFLYLTLKNEQLQSAIPIFSQKDVGHKFPLFLLVNPSNKQIILQIYIKFDIFGRLILYKQPEKPSYNGLMTQSALFVKQSIGIFRILTSTYVLIRVKFHVHQQFSEVVKNVKEITD